MHMKQNIGLISDCPLTLPCNCSIIKDDIVSCYISCSIPAINIFIKRTDSRLSIIYNKKQQHVIEFSPSTKIIL